MAVVELPESMTAQKVVTYQVIMNLAAWAVVRYRDKKSKCVAWVWMVYVAENATGGLAWVVLWCVRERYVLTYINDMLIHINLNSLDMSILFRTFAVEKVIN